MEDGPKKTKQTNEGTTKMGTKKGKKDNMKSSKEQQKQAETAQGNTPSPNPQETGLKKRPDTQIGGTHKKIKAQRTAS
jgi:hypothetical protein